MALKYKLYDKQSAVKHGVEIMTTAILPLLQKHWKSRGEALYDAPLQFNLEQFTTLWVTGGLTLVVAYEDERPVGILIGIRFRPMLFDRQVLMVENIWGERADIMRGIYDYVIGLLPVFNVDEIWVQADVNDARPDNPAVTLQRNTAVLHYVRT